MTYATEHIIQVLKAARLGKHLTQRELSAQAGVPQAHLSKIESGKVDLRLSSVIELARTLDLEVLVVPRKSLAAVQAVIRSGEGDRTVDVEGARLAGKELKRIAKAVKRLLGTSPDNEQLVRLHRAVAELAILAPGSKELDDLRGVVRELGERPVTAQILHNITSALQRIRSELLHRATQAPVSAPRPAYSLDVDEGEVDA